MSPHALAPGMSREALLDEVLAAERETHDLLEQAARLATDAEERALFEHLAQREADALRELAGELDRFDAESFVQRAIGC